MGRRLFLPSSYANIQRELVQDPMTGEISVVLHEDLDVTFKANNRRRLDNPKGYVQGDRDMRTIATITPTLANIILRETGIDVLGCGAGRDLHEDEWKIINGRYLKNPDYSKFRTSDMVM
jgi:hypothetical protein